MKKTGIVIAIIVGAFILIKIFNPFYTVEEGNQAIILRFGEIVRPVTEKGLHVKIPVIDRVQYVTTKLMSWDGDSKVIPTSEKQFIEVDPTARWRIVDQVLFYKALSTYDNAQDRLDKIISSSIKTVISQHSLNESVRTSNEIFDYDKANPSGEDGSSSDKELAATYEEVEKGRETLAKMITDDARTQTDRLGIEIIDVVIRQIRYADDLTESVYDRMISERRQRAEAIRSKGEGEKQEWLGRQAREKDVILSTAYAEAEAIKGEADATASAIYAKSYGADRDFYNYWRSIESYKKTLKKLDKIMTTDPKYFQYLY